MQVKRVETAEELSRCLALREEVFVVEQHVPVELELDEHDAICVHFLASEGGAVVGTARLKPTGTKAKAQRVAVKRSHRSRGVGRLLMAALEDCARERGLSSVLLSSQVSAIPFYERLGYRAEGPVYEDAGIPHRDMEKAL